MVRPPIAPPGQITSLHVMLKHQQIENLGKLCAAWGLQRPAAIRKLIDDAAKSVSA